MRTTIRLPDELYNELRRHAVQEGTTVTSIIEEAVRVRLTAHLRQQRERFVVRPYAGSGVQPGVDLSDSAALLEVMEG